MSPAKHTARTILGRMETFAGQLYSALCPFWIVHAAPAKRECVLIGIKTSNLIVRGKDFARGQDACCEPKAASFERQEGGLEN